MADMKKKKIETADLVRVALGAALMCVLSPLNFPLGTTHITLAIFGVYLVAAVFGKYRATLSMVIYIAIGAVGLPIFRSAENHALRLKPPRRFPTNMPPAYSLDGNRPHRFESHR